MKPNLFKYSVLTVGVVAAMGVATGANAAQPATSTTAKEVVINNSASATYKVEGTDAEQTAISNKVTVTVSETGSFTLKAISLDNDDLNKDLKINPQANQSAEFKHTLKNDGNVTDKYTLDITQATNDDFNYSTVTITYTTPSITTATTYVPADGITLALGEVATIIITATSSVQRTVGKNGVLTVTASSKYLKDKGGAVGTYQASNTDNAITKTPIYAITKSANTSLNNNIFDTANTNAYIDYTITIKNEGNEVATAFDIVDTLPTGLVVSTNFKPKINNEDAPNDSFNLTNDNKTINFVGRDLAEGATITVTFRAIKDSAIANIDSKTDLVNYATVRDNTLSNTSTNDADLIDRSDDGTGENNYEGSSGFGKDDNTDAAVSTRNQTRNITISQGADKEVPLISSNTVYNYTITNGGTDITEATKADDVLFTVLPTIDNTKVSIVKVYVDSNNNSVFDENDVKLVQKSGATGTYDLYEAVKNTDAAVNGLSAKEAVKIFVVVDTNGTAGDGVAGDIGTSETMTIKVSPQKEVNGTAKPADASTTSKTTMQGIILVKQQAVSSCTSPGTLNYVTIALSGKPGQCIYYKITAQNTFNDTSKVIKPVTIIDNFDTNQVAYNTNSFSSTVSNDSAPASDSYSEPTLKGTFASLKARETGTINFSTTISATGATTSNP